MLPAGDPGWRIQNVIEGVAGVGFAGVGVHNYIAESRQTARIAASAEEVAVKELRQIVDQMDSYKLRTTKPIPQQGPYARVLNVVANEIVGVIQNLPAGFDSLGLQLRLRDTLHRNGIPLREIAVQDQIKRHIGRPLTDAERVAIGQRVGIIDEIERGKLDPVRFSHSAGEIFFGRVLPDVSDQYRYRMAALEEALRGRRFAAGLAGVTVLAGGVIALDAAVRIGSESGGGIELLLPDE